MSSGRHTNAAALGAAIVHLGIGAFARAHLAAVNEAALHATGDLRWGIVGVSLRQADTRDALAPQDGLYALGLRDADADGTPRESLRIIGGLREVLVAPEAPAAVLERIAAAETRIVSLTVTEKGYCHDPASGALRVRRPRHRARPEDAGRAAQRDRLHRARAAARGGSAAIRRSPCCRATTCRRTDAPCAASCSRSRHGSMPACTTGSNTSARFRTRWSTASCRARPPTTVRASRPVSAASMHGRWSPSRFSTG